MRRVVVTGMGIVSSIGNNTQEVTASLREAKSGISFATEFADHGFKCQVYGKPTLDPSAMVDRRAMRFLRHGLRLEPRRDGAGDPRRGPRGQGHRPIRAPASSWARADRRPDTVVEAADITRTNNSPKRIGPFAVPKAMSSSPSATLATWFKIKGVNYYDLVCLCDLDPHASATPPR